MEKPKNRHKKNQLPADTSIDWTRYPLVRLFIPFLIGIILGHLCIIEWHWAVNPKISILITCGLVCGQIVADYLFSKQPYRRKGIFFNLLTYIIFLLFGLTLSSNSHSKALKRYGDSLQYEIYKQNRFQNEKALILQQELHHRFYAGSTVWSEHRDECAVVEAMTIGWRKDLSKEIKQRYAHAGISHYLALSGYHVGIIFLLLSYIFRHISHTFTGRNVCHVAILLILWGYALLTGMSPSIVRATIMCSVITIFHLLQHDIELINACTLAAFIILAVDPLLISHIGFQLSFCSVYGLALMSRWIPWNFFVGGLAVCIICTVVTAPLVAYHFGEVPIYGMLTNIYATFLAPPILILSMLWWIVTGLGHLMTPLSDGIATLLLWVTWSLNKIANCVSHFPHATLHIRLDWAEVLLCYACIIALIRLFWRKMGAGFGFFKE